MATYVLSDIHGLYDKFMAMLEKIDFKDSDQLYIIGDVIDRGPNGIKIYQEILKHPNIEVIKGNHEVFFLEAFDYFIDGDTFKEINFASFKIRNSIWYHNGCEPTIDQFLELELKERIEIFKYIKSEKDYKIIEINNQKYLLVHAGLFIYEGIPFEKLMEINIRKEHNLWIREDFLDSEYQKLDDMTIIFGHTPTYYIPEYMWNPEILTKECLRRCKQSKIFYGKGKIGIDCGCAMNKNLGCLRLDDMKEFYT